MKTLDANARIELVKRVRTEFRPHFFMRCLEVAYRVIPCCESCEHNLQETCTAPQLTFQDEISFSGLSIKDKETLCIQWSPSPASIISAMKYIYDPDRLKPKPKPQKIEPAYSIEELSEQIRRFHSGETTAEAAAEELQMGLSTFYQKAADYKKGKF